MVGRPRRLSRLLGYTLMSIAGVAAFITPAPSVRAATSGILVYVWAAFLAVGGAAAAGGSLTDRWLGEYTGLPLLAATFAVYGLAALTTGRWTSVAGGCALLALALVFVARWQDVALIRREAARQARRDRRA